MWQVLRTPRWIALTAFALLAIVLCIVAGRWQWQRTQDIVALERASQQVPVAVAELSPVGKELPASSFGRPVTAVGSFNATKQVFVAQRLNADKPGFWVVSDLALDDGTSIAIVRGWVPSRADPAADVPSGQVTVHGILQPWEYYYPESGIRPDGTILSVRGPLIGQLWGADVRSGYVVLTTQDPASNPAPTPVKPAVSADSVEFPWQNFFYAWQWWVFVGFVIAIWIWWLRLDIRVAREERDHVPSAS